MSLMSALRTKPPFALAAIAEAEFVRKGRTSIAALQPKSSDRSFKTRMKPGFQTAFSLQPGSAIKIRDEGAEPSRDHDLEIRAAVEMAPGG